VGAIRKLNIVIAKIMEDNNIQNNEVSPEKKKGMTIGIIGDGGLIGAKHALAMAQKDIGTLVKTEIPEIVSKLALKMADKGVIIIVGATDTEPSYKIENGVASVFDGKVVTDSEGKRIVLDDSKYDKQLPLSLFERDSPSLVSKAELLNEMIPSMEMFDGTPNKLSLIRNLKLSPEQIDYFMFAPPQRLEGEKHDDYKRRQMLNKLLIKYRGLY